MGFKQLIFFIGTDANGFTSKDHLEIGKKLQKFEDNYLRAEKLWGPGGLESLNKLSLINSFRNPSARNLTIEREYGRELQKHLDADLCNIDESSCIQPIIDDHFKSSLASNASTGKNDSNPTEKPASALNLPKSSQTGISNINLTVGIMTSKPTDITE